MSALFDYPKKAKFGRMVAKSKIYGRAKPSRKIQEKFINQIGKITWGYKLAPETINLQARSGVQEIEVFEITLKLEEIDVALLKCIDKAISHPIIFHVLRGDELKVMATYKRPSDADSHRWVIGDTYFASKWLSNDTARRPLPTALDMAGMYEKIFRDILPLPARDGEELTNQINRAEQVIAKEKEHKKLKARIDKEKQFNRKVEMNAKLRTLESDIKKLRN